jgi:hypothetical protein
MRTTTFALVLGAVYAVIGVLGLIPAALLPPPPDAPPLHFTVLSGYLLGVFPVNVLHTAVHLATGLWGLVACRRIARSITYCYAVALFYGTLCLAGLVPGLDAMYGTLPIHGPDVWLHGTTAVLAAYFAWRGEASPSRRQP